MATSPMRGKVAEAKAAQSAGVAQVGKTIFETVRTLEPQFRRALPSQVDAGRFVRVAMTTLRTNPKLLRCSEASLLGALMLSAQLGLEPGGPLGHAYLVPFGQEITFIIGYKGFIDLASRSGRIAGVSAEAVFEGDQFTWQLGLHRDIVHFPVAPERDDPAKVTHVYAVARYNDGADESFIVLTRRQVESFQNRSKAKNDGPWKTDWTAMALKTAVRRLATWLPLTVEAAAAVRLDEGVVSGPIDLDDAALTELDPVPDPEAAEVPDSAHDDEGGPAASGEEPAQPANPETEVAG